MRKSLTLTFVVTLIACFLLSCSAGKRTADLEWRNGWVRALPPGAVMTAAYGELRNTSQKSIEFTAFVSNAFAQVSLHQSSTEQGVTRMREQRSRRIAAGETMLLQPGGLHLMLMKPTSELNLGDEVEIGISSADRHFVFSLPVESR
jgi:copper(I)-binding protein